MTDTARSRLLPVGTVDTHVHVFTPEEHPYAPNRAYTPGTADVQSLRNHLGAVGADRVVLVQPSVYGTDNRALLTAIEQLGTDIARGVAVIDALAAGTEIAALRESGVRGLRLNGRADPRRQDRGIAEGLRELVARAADHSLFVETYSSAAALGRASQEIIESPVPVILDHFGGVVDHDGHLDGIEEILSLYRSESIWLKLSAPTRVCRNGQKCGCLRGFVESLTEVSPDRLVWATDWPHTGGSADRTKSNLTTVEPFRRVDDVAEAARLRSWLGEAIAQQVFVENPNRLFGFSHHRSDRSAPGGRIPLGTSATTQERNDA